MYYYCCSKSVVTSVQRMAREVVVHVVVQRLLVYGFHLMLALLKMLPNGAVDGEEYEIFDGEEYDLFYLSNQYFKIICCK